MLSVGALLLVLAIAVAGIQLRAHRCPRHQKTAGVLAWIIVALCSLGGIALIAKGLSAVQELNAWFS